MAKKSSESDRVRKRDVAAVIGGALIGGLAAGLASRPSRTLTVIEPVYTPSYYRPVVRTVVREVVREAPRVARTEESDRTEIRESRYGRQVVVTVKTETDYDQFGHRMDTRTSDEVHSAFCLCSYCC
jgi:hypothetical protein